MGEKSVKIVILNLNVFKLFVSRQTKVSQDLLQLLFSHKSQLRVHSNMAEIPL